jgi:hypothetical protein
MNTSNLIFEATVLQSTPTFYSVSNSTYEITEILSNYKDKNIKNK